MMEPSVETDFYADRKVSPKMQEVKFQYQSVKLLPEETKVIVKTKIYLFL